MDYERRHAPTAATRRESVDRDRTHLLATFEPYALRELAEDLDRRLPLGEADAWRTAQALATAMQ